MSNYKIQLITTALSLTFASAAWASPGEGDGDVAADKSPAPIARKAGCLAGAGYCPEFPAGLRLERAALVEALKHLSGCEDGEHAATKDRDRIAEAGAPQMVSRALAHLALSEPSLSLHDVKNAMALMVELGGEDGLAALREVAARSEAIAARTAELGPIAALDRGAREDFAKRQGEELRRLVVLAVAADKSSAATAFLEEASADNGRSVAIAARRALASRGR